MYQIFDVEGQEQNQDWLDENYGADIVVTPCSQTGKYFRLVAMYENHGESGLKVTVYNAELEPDKKRNIAFHWTGADYHAEGCATMWSNNFIADATNDNGDVAFGMGNGAYYWPPQEKGPHAVWVCSSLESDTVSGLGMLSGTNHNHMDMVFQLVDAGEEPDVPDVPDVPNDPDEPQEPCGCADVVEVCLAAMSNQQDTINQLIAVLAA